MSEFAEDDDLFAITGYRRANEQRKVLDEEGIPYKPRGTKTLVLKIHVRAWFEGAPIRRHAEPNMGAIT